MFSRTAPKRLRDGFILDPAVNQYPDPLDLDNRPFGYERDGDVFQRVRLEPEDEVVKVQPGRRPTREQIVPGD
jgi:hypothetical protein